MNVVEINIYLQERGVSEAGIFKDLAGGINRLCSWKVDPNFEKDNTNDEDNLNNSWYANPFYLRTVNNFNSPPPFVPFGLYDFSKPGLAAYNWY